MESIRWDHNAHYHRLLLRAVPSPCRRALDVGCGDGAFARRLAERADIVEAVDLSAEAIAAAEEHVDGCPNVRFRVCDFRQLRFDGAYDYVAALASLHHVEFEDALAKLKVLVRPGGVVAVLGCFQERSKTDLLASLLALPVNRHYLRKYGEHTYPLPTAEPTMSLREIRGAAARILPGARVRRRLLWRYSILWTRSE